MKKYLPTCKRHSSGQALIECIVILVVLGSLFAIIPLIGKYQDINHATLVGSHYAAFDSTFYQKSASTTEQRKRISRSVQRQFFSAAETPVITDLEHQANQGNKIALWNMPQGSKDSSLMAQTERIRVRVGLAPTDYDQRAFTVTSDGKPFSLSESLDLPTRGFYTANVIAPLAPIQSTSEWYRPFNTLKLTMAHHTSLLIKPWNDSSPSNVATHIKNSAAVFPVSRLEENNALKATKDLTVGATVKVIDYPGKIPAPALGKLDFWEDVVPQDRLKIKAQQ